MGAHDSSLEPLLAPIEYPDVDDRSENRKAVFLVSLLCLILVGFSVLCVYCIYLGEKPRVAAIQVCII
ncbi:hypothetical protein KIPB_013302 [Kipferlia bialata]|uniref:Uncharacterized protein n=1 Tax=Kipferlia bialata TaxID=797122 RepID=A0A391P8N9_9EUKA|nr:hypothetical protein KIPB_013302 [Kipferlia bialata]|eukprot:g13302.t1